MTDHYFSAAPGTAERRRMIKVTIWGTEMQLITAAGVFSPDALDRGTAILLRASSVPAGNPRLLDLGCGYGPIALALAVHCPNATVDAVDINERALALCRDNATALGVVDRVHISRPEDVDPDVKYDEIWSNPPIRIGKEALHTLLESWLRRLQPSGVARLVVGKNLGADTLQRWLTTQAYSCERIASAQGYRVFEVRIAG